MEVASQEDTAQLPIAELGAYERPAHPELIVEVLRDGRVVARTDGRDSATTGNADKTPVRPDTGANLRRIVPVATKSESFLTRISCDVALAIATAGTLARAGLRRRERASAESWRPTWPDTPMRSKAAPKDVQESPWEPFSFARQVSHVNAIFETNP